MKQLSREWGSKISPSQLKKEIQDDNPIVLVEVEKADVMYILKISKDKWKLVNLFTFGFWDVFEGLNQVIKHLVKNDSIKKVMIFNEQEELKKYLSKGE